MNLDEAIKQLNIYSIRNNCLKLDRETFIEQNDTESEFVKDKVAIETVLNELDNSIPKSKIIDKLNQITKEYVDYEKPIEDYKKEYNLSFVRSEQYNSMRCVLEELLEGEE